MDDAVLPTTHDERRRVLLWLLRERFAATFPWDHDPGLSVRNVVRIWLVDLLYEEGA